MRVNLRALETRAPDHAARARFQELAVLLTGSPEATADDGIAWLDALGAALRCRGLSRYGMTAADIPALVQKAKVASSMKANPAAADRRRAHGDRDAGAVAAPPALSGGVVTGLTFQSTNT